MYQGLNLILVSCEQTLKIMHNSNKIQSDRDRDGGPYQLLSPISPLNNHSGHGHGTKSKKAKYSRNPLRQPAVGLGKRWSHNGLVTWPGMTVHRLHCQIWTAWRFCIQMKPVHSLSKSWLGIKNQLSDYIYIYLCPKIWQRSITTVLNRVTEHMNANSPIMQREDR